VLRNLNTFYVWYGRGCNQDERKYAVSFVQQLKVNDHYYIVNYSKRSEDKVVVNEIEEGREEYEFWRLLGGKMDYANSANIRNDEFEPRLFLCSNASGTFKVMLHTSQIILELG
jgi:hypothetical protein